MLSKFLKPGFLKSFPPKKALHFYFSSEIQVPEDKTKLVENLQNISSIAEKSYDPPRFIKVNDPELISKVIKEEEQEIKNRNYRYSFSNFKFPLLFIFLTGFFFHCWFTIPYKVVYKHVTITPDYSITPKYIYSWLFAPLSVRNTQDFLIYFPLMIHSLGHLNKFLKPKHFIAFFLCNGLLCGLSAYFYEKFVNENEKFKGKCLGGSTVIFFASVFWAMKPGYRVFGLKILQYEVIMGALLGYESVAKRRNEKEISKIAHLLAFFNGALVGRYCKGLAF